MRARLAVLPVLITVLAATTVAVVPSTAATPAAAACTYTPVLAKEIIVDKPTINFLTPVRISGANCTREFGATVFLVHGSDSYELAWDQDSLTASDAVYATTVVPGVYRTNGVSTCSTTGPDGTLLTCAVGSGSTIIRFGGDTHLSVQRLTGSKANRVRFTVKATHYAPYSTAYIKAKVSIQRKHNGKWHTIHTAKAKGSHGYVWTYTDSHAATYRAVSSATSTTWADKSKTVKR